MGAYFFLRMQTMEILEVNSRQWLDNFTRLSEVLHMVVQMWEHRIGRNNSRQWLDIFQKF